MNAELSDSSLHFEISAVLVRYASGIDRREWDLFRSCFTPDCAIDYGEIGAWNGPAECAVCGQVWVIAVTPWRGLRR